MDVRFAPRHGQAFHGGGTFSGFRHPFQQQFLQQTVVLHQLRAFRFSHVYSPLFWIRWNGKPFQFNSRVAHFSCPEQEGESIRQGSNVQPHSHLRIVLWPQGWRKKTFPDEPFQTATPCAEPEFMGKPISRANRARRLLSSSSDTARNGCRADALVIVNMHGIPRQSCTGFPRKDTPWSLCGSAWPPE